MKITKESINHNVIKLIDDATQMIWDEPNEGVSPKMTEAYIRGILELARELKKVLEE